MWLKIKVLQKEAALLSSQRFPSTKVREHTGKQLDIHGDKYTSHNRITLKQGSPSAGEYCFQGDESVRGIFIGNAAL